MPVILQGPNGYFNHIQQPTKPELKVNLILDAGINWFWRMFYRIYRPYRKQNDKIIKRQK